MDLGECLDGLRPGFSLKMGQPFIISSRQELARIFYTVLKTKTPYQKEASDTYDENYQKLQLKRLHKQAARFGFQLQPASST